MSSKNMILNSKTVEGKGMTMVQIWLECTMYSSSNSGEKSPGVIFLMQRTISLNLCGVH